MSIKQSKAPVSAGVGPTSLVHGCNVISRKQRYMQIPTGYLYHFDTQPPHRPRPLSIFVVLINCMPPILTLFGDLLSQALVTRIKSVSPEFQSVGSSVFINRLMRLLIIYRIVATVANVVIVLAQHGSMANTISSSNIYVSEREQTNFANRTFIFFFMKSTFHAIAYLSALSLYYFNANETFGWNCVAMVVLYLIMITKMIHNSPLAYTCYLGSSLGRHVENFSKIYVDTMFDQFMKAIEKEDLGALTDQMHTLPFFDTHSLSSKENTGAAQSTACCSGCYGYLCALKHHTVRGLVNLYNFTRNVASRLNMSKYPELPEMKMTKLSTTTNIQISETMRTANSHLIRVRLRRTQIMLSELRDLVSDINKTSSPIILMYLAYDTVLIILVTTASIQAKVYKSFDVLILPTISITLGLVANVIYLCTCLDETTKQLKLLINKLFDFIIMNQRVQSTGKRAAKSKGQIHTADSEVCILSGSEEGAINETWSQFQYTRKLANTIQFTMGGILPVTRRLVLSILGHVLSAVFISIEIMSIIDTLNTPHGSHHAKPSMNVSSTQYEMRDSHLSTPM